MTLPQRRFMVLSILAIALVLLAACNLQGEPIPTPLAAVDTPAPAGIANPASVHCTEQGGTLEIRKDAAGNETGYCLFADGSECEEWAFYRGECQPAQPTTPGAEPVTSTQTLPGEPAPAAGAEDLAAQVLATLPAGAFGENGVAVLPLNTPVGQPPLWAVYSTGMRNFDLNPAPSHFLAIYTQRSEGWQQLAATNLDDVSPREPSLVEPMPDYIDEGGVQQVALTPDRVWLTVDGGVGAHSGVYQVYSFDGQTLKQELAAGASSPGLGSVRDVNGDGQNDVVLDVSEPYIFCYACGVRHPYFKVYTPMLDGELMPIEISALMMGQRGSPADVANSEAVHLAQADLWQQAVAKIDEAVSLADGQDLPAGNGSLLWNQALIHMNHDALQAAVQDSAYPLLSNVFYGDYAAAVDAMRAYSPEQIFSADSPLVVGTAAQDWQNELAGYLRHNTDAALAVRPDLAQAYFLRAWSAYLANPASSQVGVDLARAAALAPDDAFYSAAAASQPKAQPLALPTGAGAVVRVYFRSGAEAVSVPGTFAVGSLRVYVLQAAQGQTMTVSLDAPDSGASLAVWGADGTVLLSQDAGVTDWQGQLPTTQDYYVALYGATKPVAYRLHISIPPLAQ